MENIKSKKTRGRPSVKKLVENIEMKIQEQKPEFRKNNRRALSRN